MRPVTSVTRQSNHSNERDKDMKLESSEFSKQFVKFRELGDKVSGRFVLLDPARATPFGPKTVLELQSEEFGQQEITCPTSLARILIDNRAKLLPGVVLTIEFVRTIPTTKGNPAKIFDVDIQPAATATATKPRPAQHRETQAAPAQPSKPAARQQALAPTDDGYPDDDLAF